MAAREKRLVTYKVNAIRLLTDFLQKLYRQGGSSMTQSKYQKEKKKKPSCHKKGQNNAIF